MSDVKIHKLPPKVEQVKPAGLVLDEHSPYPIVIQYFRPDGIDVTILSPGALNMRKIEIAMLQTARKLRLMRSAEVREQNKLEQVAATAAEGLSLTEPEEDKKWP